MSFQDKGQHNSAWRSSQHGRSAVLGLLVAVIATVAFILVLYMSVTPSGGNSAEFVRDTPPSQEISTTTTITYEEIIPTKLAIPSLKVDAEAEHVSINAKGSIGTPSSFSKVAWYQEGVKPGGPGLAIIDGHVNNGLGLNGVFADLGKMDVGADIYIQDVQGTQLHFVVVSTTTLAYTSRLSDLTDLGTPGVAEVALVTCEGAWVPASKTYDRRLVVIAQLVQ